MAVPWTLYPTLRSSAARSPGADSPFMLNTKGRRETGALFPSFGACYQPPPPEEPEAAPWPPAIDGVATHQTPNLP